MKKEKGMTLVEVIVATLVFTLTFGVVCSTYILSKKGEQKQREYLHFETMCLEFDEYSDKYGYDWAKKYFNDDTINGNFTKYLNSQYVVCDQNNASYIIDVKFDNVDTYFDNKKYPDGDPLHKEMIVNIADIKNRCIIDNLVYGSRGGRYEKK